MSRKNKYKREDGNCRGIFLMAYAGKIFLKDIAGCPSNYITTNRKAYCRRSSLAVDLTLDSRYDARGVRPARTGEEEGNPFCTCALSISI